MRMNFDGKVSRVAVSAKTKGAVMSKPKHGDESTCRHCGETIRFCRKSRGVWKHWPGPRSDELPLHNAEPVKKRKGRDEAPTSD